MVPIFIDYKAWLPNYDFRSPKQQAYMEINTIYYLFY